MSKKTAFERLYQLGHPRKFVRGGRIELPCEKTPPGYSRLSSPDDTPRIYIRRADNKVPLFFLSCAVGVVGFEPTIFPGPKPGALTRLGHTPARRERFELPTIRSVIERSIQAELTPQTTPFTAGA